MPVRRRTFLKTALAAPVACAMPGFAAERERSYLAEAPDMLLAHIAGKLNALAAKWDEERARIRTAADLQARNAFVRKKLHEMLVLPERTPLGAVVVRTHQRDGYRVENVMYQSRPDFWVTGNLYIPEGNGPFPAILSPCGHYQLARMQPDYQYVYLNLVKAGFVVLGYDPIGQGERRQYWNPETNHADISDPVYEHSMPGQVQLLMGDNLSGYRVWDGMRGIDYLLTRPEVDKERIGCAGHSGGGTLTLFISAADERVRCAVVNEGGTTHRWPVRAGGGGRLGPSDVEQNIFPAAVYGIDNCDMHVSIAPRPLLTMIENYNPAFNRTADHIRERYKLLGVPEKFATEEATDPHAYTVKLRQATTNWFSRWFYSRPGPAREPEIEAEKPETLYCTPNGSVRYSRQGETIFTLLEKKQATLPPARQAAASAGEISEAIRFRNPGGPLAPRLLVTTPRKGYQIEKLEFVSEPGIYIPAWVFVPERRTTDAVSLYVNEAGKEHDGMEFGPYEALARKGRTVISVDVRGIGGTTPQHTQSLGGPEPFTHLFSVETAMAYMTWYMDESLFGMRVVDTIRSVDYALSRPDVKRDQLEVVGQGAGALWVMYAAALDPRIPTVRAERGLGSYRTLAQTDRYAHSAGVFVRDVLKHFDLPQVAAAIAPRPLTIAGAVDAMKRGLPAEKAREMYGFAAEAYRKAGAAERFRIEA